MHISKTRHNINVSNESRKYEKNATATCIPLRSFREAHPQPINQPSRFTPARLIPVEKTGRSWASASKLDSTNFFCCNLVSVHRGVRVTTVTTCSFKNFAPQLAECSTMPSLPATNKQRFQIPSFPFFFCLLAGQRTVRVRQTAAMAATAKQQGILNVHTRTHLILTLPAFFLLNQFHCRCRHYLYNKIPLYGSYTVQLAPTYDCCWAARDLAYSPSVSLPIVPRRCHFSFSCLLSFVFPCILIFLVLIYISPLHASHSKRTDDLKRIRWISGCLAIFSSPVLEENRTQYGILCS